MRPLKFSRMYKGTTNVYWILDQNFNELYIFNRIKESWKRFLSYFQFIWNKVLALALLL